jgi:hypothetical protein
MALMFQFMQQRRGRKKGAPLLVCQTLPIFSAREAIEFDEFEVTELQLEQESDSSEDTEGALDLVLRFFNLFNVVFFADFPPGPLFCFLTFRKFFGFLDSMFSKRCSAQALSPFPSVNVNLLVHPFA